MRIAFGTRPPLRRLLHSSRAQFVAAALAIGLSCSALALTTTEGKSDRPRAVTSSEAQRLAMVRFTTFEESPNTVTVTIENDADSYVVRGLIDYRTHRAVASFVAGAEGPKPQKGLIAWDESGLAVATGKRVAPASSEIAQVARAAAKVPSGNWSPRSYSGYPLDIALRMVMALGADRPDNAQLLAQSGPRYLGESTLRGKSYARFSGPRPQPRSSGAPGSQPRRKGPSPLTYWVDEKGELGRLEIKSSAMKRPVTVDFTGRAAHAKVPGQPWRESSPRGK
ncbi:hypothetical protein ABIE67_010080 [Streptomyces sp. V4I8]